MHELGDFQGSDLVAKEATTAMVAMVMERVRRLALVEKRASMATVEWWILRGIRRRGWWWSSGF